MGCALAYQLAKRDVDVVLLERETLGSQSTGKCAGGVRQQFSMEANVRLQRMSVGMFETFQAETGHPADFRQIGYLFVLTLPQHVEDFRNNMEMWRRVGLTEARWVDASEAARMVPVLNVDDVLGCTFCPTDGIASPADVTAGYAAAARRHGARLKEGAELTGIDVAGGRVQGVRTSAGDIATRLVFNCAGAWAASIGRMAGLEIPVLPYRRQVAVTGTFPTVPRTNPMTANSGTIAISAARPHSARKNRSIADRRRSVRDLTRVSGRALLASAISASQSIAATLRPPPPWRPTSRPWSA